VKLSPKLVIGIFVVALIVGGSLFTFSIGSYSGGWNINDSGYSLTVAGVKAPANIWSFDPDGDRQRTDNMDWAAHDKPAITYELGQVHYEISSMGSWQYSASPVLLDHYTLNLTADGKKIQVYWLYMIAFEVTLKTSADSFFITRPIGDAASIYGWHYEMNAVPATALTTLALSQWTPMGEDGNWTIVGGWSGILSASCLAETHGLVEEGADENQGHTIQNLHSVNSKLNMYVDDALSGSYDFHQTGALKGVPSIVQVETSATLGAGAKYTTDTWGAWASCAVRNVFVKYTVGCEILTTLQYALKTSHIGPLINPKENNTGYAPELPGWLAGLLAVLGSPFTFIITVIVIVIVGIVIIKIVGHKK
jgi:hypothetical protein